ncbi:MAG: hypothetical protein O2967_19030, partial [Proteobacteria bacterium]|nr:hypothetical protein [Pseudomonadota bacterium]
MAKVAPDYWRGRFAGRTGKALPVVISAPTRQDNDGVTELSVANDMSGFCSRRYVRSLEAF